jgi:hypothetical protein
MEQPGLTLAEWSNRIAQNMERIEQNGQELAKFQLNYSNRAQEARHISEAFRDIRRILERIHARNNRQEAPSTFHRRSG